MDNPWQNWLAMVGHLSLPEIRCEVRPTQEVLEMIDEVGLDEWQAYTVRLERHIVRDHWTWPERNKAGAELTA